MSLKQELQSKLDGFVTFLREKERSELTISKYTHDINFFINHLPENSKLEKGLIMDYKLYLTGRYAPASANSMLAALNCFLEYSGYDFLKVSTIKIQRKVFCEKNSELTISEYKKMLAATDNEKYRRINLILQSLCSTGIRISELCFITVEALSSRRVCVSCKGKTRTVFLPLELCKKLRRYCFTRGIQTGSIFISSGGAPLNRSNIWKEMKYIAKKAHVEASKVFPHNLRHLFAKAFYEAEKDLAKLADLLGHSSIETTRIYIITSGYEHEKIIEKLGLVV